MAPSSQVLDALLHSCVGREERASTLPEAFVPPGIPLPAAVSSGATAVAGPQSSLGGSGGGGARDELRGRWGIATSPQPPPPPEPSAGGGAVIRACTTPEKLLAEIATRRSQPSLGGAAGRPQAGPQTGPGQQEPPRSGAAAVRREPNGDSLVDPDAVSSSSNNSSRNGGVLDDRVSATLESGESLLQVGL